MSIENNDNVESKYGRTRLIISFLLCSCVQVIKSCRTIFKQMSSVFERTHADADICSRKEFLSVNQNVWKDALQAVNGKCSDGYVMIDAFCVHSGYLLINLIVGMHIASLRNLKPIGVLKKSDKKIEALFKSYGVREYVYLDDASYSLRTRIQNLVKALRIVWVHRSADEFLRYQMKGIHFGKIVYDDYLRHSGMGTVQQVDWLLLHRITKGICCCDALQGIFEKYKITALVQGERQFVPGAILAQTALKNNATLYARGGGPKRFTIRSYSRVDEFYTNTHRPDRSLFEYVCNNYKDEAIKVGASYIQKRFSGESAKNDIPDALYAFKRDEKIVTRNELCSQLGWDPEKKIIGIMGNMLTDGVFTNNWTLFRDNLIWLRETLKYVRKLDHVNWLVKAHPSDKKNNVVITARDEYQKWCKDLGHIRFLPDEIGPRSLKGIIDTVLTVRGSAGIEYAHFGIPCVLGGESLYSGFGFSYEPKSIDEYYSYLDNIDKLKGLTEEQKDMAKIFTYIYLDLSRVESDLIPEFNVFKNYNENKLWKDTLRNMRYCKISDDRMKNMLEIQLKRGDERLLNYDWIGIYN
jgi:hypothetical protein